jgi:hypothetical protein
MGYPADGGDKVSYPTHDTQWAESNKGNLWRRRDGEVLVVGKSKTTGKFWARNGDGFIPGSFESLRAAKHAAETGRKPDHDDDIFGVGDL